MELHVARLALKEEEASACLVRPDGRILYCNPAWNAFAEGNQGAPGALAEAVVGRSWRSFIRGEEVASSLHRFMERAIGGESVGFLSECNSSALGRVLMCRFDPIRARGDGRVLAVSATYDVVRSCPIAELHEPQPVDDALYRDGDGLIHMCAFCRRVQRGGDGRRWDFVPRYLEQVDLTISHGYCSTCFALLADD